MVYKNGESPKEKEQKKYYRQSEFMTDEEITEINECLTLLNQNKGEMSKYYSEWADIDTSYRGDQAKEKNLPNTRVNIFNANIEGQVSNIVDMNMSVMTRGEGPSDQSFANWARIGLDWTLRKNRFKKVLAKHERRRELFGAGIFKVYFDPNEFYGFGLTKICCPPLNKIFIDNKVKDDLRFQEAEYIAETIRYSKTQFINIYGDKKSSAISYGLNSTEDMTTFSEEETNDDDNSATLIQWWSRQEGKLRLREFSGCGILLYDSHKEGGRKDNQKNSNKKIEPYYNYVNNKYPYFFTGLYPIEGKLFGFGDGKLLQPLQKMLNDLYDKIRITAKPNLILYDPSILEADLSDFDLNSLEPRPANLIQGKAIESVPWGQLNESWWRLLLQIHEEIQRVTRFSYLMLGQRSSADTATEAAIQQQQGNSSSDHKKLMLQETTAEMCEYVLGIMIDNYTEAKAFRIDENKEDYEWIDFRQLANVPVMQPTTQSFRNEYIENNPDKEPPMWQVLEDESGNQVTKNIDLDIEISMGQGLPKNKSFLYQMSEKLSQLVSDGQNVIHYPELRKFLKDFLGLPLMDDAQLQEYAMQQAQMQQQAGAINESANTEGLTAEGNPQMRNLPLVNQGGGLSA